MALVGCDSIVPTSPEAVYRLRLTGDHHGQARLYQ
jgi:hypothetical protein